MKIPALAGLALVVLAWATPCDARGLGARTPNILFIIMDDVGIDQMRLFGYGGATPPSTPTIDEIARAGTRFRNTWAMPACTTSRAVFFTGRYPLRTNVFGALGPDDLANSQVSPFETTVPKLLASRGYASALFGKFHLGLQGHNPAGLGMPHALGWNYFAGWLDETGDPSSIDSTAGGVSPEGTWSCGFVRGADAGGADAGACYMGDGTCSQRSRVGAIPPGRTCRDQGGIFDPGKSCQAPAPSYVNFQTLSAHYVSPLVINHEDGTIEEVPRTAPAVRHFRATVAVDAAVGWIKGRSGRGPWMATVSFASAHTPVMQPPADQVRSEPPGVSALDCSNTAAQRVLTNLMIESLDTEVGRLLLALGLARVGAQGQLIYHPEQTNTMVIIVGDNGTLGSAVKEPLDPTRAKGTAYQTGVWVPLIVAGPLVRNPDRVVSHMVNVADLYALFGEIAGIDIARAVPRPIDARPLLPYLLDPDQPSIRTSNFTQVGPNIQANLAVNGPCTIGQSCTQIPVSRSVCHDNNGTWWGPGPDDPTVPAEGLARCCNVSAHLAAQGQPVPSIQPDSSLGIRNDRYKIVENTTYQYVSQAEPCVQTTAVEFYEINEDAPIPRLDKDGTQLPLGSLTPEQQQNFNALSAELSALRAAAPQCPGDGNIDGLVNRADLADWQFFATSYGGSSVYDLNFDGVTDAADRSIIEQHLGLDCRVNVGARVRKVIE
jgi:arylsulfatase A-like enzyme